ncbi:MAG TPA: hypothetical protein VMX79_02510 [bacterium]|nr:hypothetical protein [bacterium]
MVKIFTALTLVASTALAFAPTHLVVVEGAVLYDEDHNYGDDYIVERLPYWTPVVAEPVGTPESPRTYCLVTLEDGRRGLTEWDYLGRALTVVAEETTLAGVPADVPADVTRLKKGAVLAFAPTAEAGSRPGFIEVLNEDGLRGWVPEDAVAPAPGVGE